MPRYAEHKNSCGEKKGPEQYWHCVEPGYICNHAISGGLWRKHSVLCGGRLFKHSITYCVGSEICKYFCGKNNTKSKMLFFGGRGENLRIIFVKHKLKFSTLALLSRKQKSIKREELKERKKCALVLLRPLLFVKITLSPFLEFVFGFSIYKYTVYLLTVYKDMYK